MPAPTAKKQEPAKWYTIRASDKPVAGAVQVATSAEILIYGDIGESWYDDTIAAKDFVREVAALDADTIIVRINSFGGSVTDGIAIFNALKRHKASVTTVVDTIAASVASLAERFFAWLRDEKIDLPPRDSFDWLLTRKGFDIACAGNKGKS